MSEIYRNSTQFVYLDIYGDTADAPPTAVCHTHSPEEHESELTVNGPETLDNGAERWTAVLGLVHTQKVEETEVHWYFSIDGVEATKTDYFDIVVPYVELNDARSELELGDEISSSSLVSTERRVRKIIERYCGQKFMPTHETLVVHGNGDYLMRLPKRALQLETVTNNRSGLSLLGFSTRNDGWYLKRSLDYEWNDVVTVNGPIYDPFRGATARWRDEDEWAITGLWGWQRPPSAVSEAAMILMEQRLCDQAKYRDQYLSSMKAADWRFDFFPEVNYGTGNVVADQLLGPYVVVNMAAI